jgi:hypothetical protein
MKKKLFIPAIILLLFICSGLSSQDNTSVRNPLTPEELIYFDEMLSIARNNINYLNREQIESDQIKKRYAEAENLFFALRHSEGIKDPDLLKRYLTTLTSELVNESGDRVDFVKRMNLLYWMMVSIGLMIIVTLIIYSIYMYAKRK